jgi:hypothetical protein
MRVGLADLKRITPQVVAIQLDQVEGVQKHAAVSAVVPDEVERGNAIVVAGDSFTIDDAGAGAQPGERLHDQRELALEVVAGTAIEPHLPVVLAGNDAEAIMLDFVQPLAAGGQCRGFCRKARRDKSGREGTLQHNAHS